MGDILATTDMYRKLGAVLLFRERAESPSSTMWPWPTPTFVPSDILIHPTVWPQQTWVEKLRAAVPPPPFGWRGAGSSSNTIWPGPSPTSVPSFTLIQPTVWPQYTNVTDRQYRQTENDLIAYRANPRKNVSTVQFSPTCRQLGRPRPVCP